ncbi:hypothetical protein [Actinoplanes sp. NBRC 103695]|uniref:hypothetical protein n=1 Tax=Actinoplanes sp. NBRC 103695 TaxID=3032202 RepID=UPI0024A58B89|nr:hypothetical protein [Actinoplanes sp. NBRC 103695]GLZ00813.1 hypothetical protein Acsp02_80650 [Actinoplanes sp. NBRC 103695]
MTENVVDQTTPATAADQPSATDERPAAPQGSVYLSDVLASIRRHVSANGWCSTAEDVTLQALNDGLAFEEASSEPGCGPSCKLCYPEATTPADSGPVVERFTAAEGTDPFITKARLKKAIRKAYDLGYDWDQCHTLYRELIDTYELDEVPLPVTTYTVAFTVTDEHLDGQAPDEDGMAHALRAGVTADFTVAAESTEMATPTLRP